MEYRINRRTGDKISIIGLGASSISQAGEKEGIETLKMAFDNGINYFDLAGGDAECFPYYGEAFENVRDKYGQEARVGCVVPDSTIADEGVIKSLTGIDIRIREAKDEKLMIRIADELISDGYDIIIGGGYLRAYCELHGIRFSAIGLEDFAISRAVNSAVSAAEADG